MARTLDDIHNFINFMVRKERGAWLSPSEIDALLDNAQMEFYEYLINEYAITQKIHDALSPFKKNTTTQTGSDGSIDLPSDYLHLRSASCILGSTLYKVQFVEDDEFVEALKSQLRPVSVTRPIGKIEEGFIYLYPQTIHYASINYFRRPLSPSYVFTENGREIIYDPINSVQLEWQDTVYINKIILKSLSYLGINLNEQDITQFGVQYDKTVD